MKSGRHALGGDFQLVAARGQQSLRHALGVAHIAEADVLADRVAPAGAGELADRSPSRRIVSRPSSTMPGSSTVKQASRFCRRLVAAAPAARRGRGRACLRLSFTAQPRPASNGVSSGLISRAPGAIAFLEPQRLDGAIAGVGDAVRPAGLHQRVEDRERGLHRHVQFPAELADIGDAQRPHRRARDHDLAPRAEREGGVGHVGVGHSRPARRARAGPSATARA